MQLDLLSPVAPIVRASQRATAGMERVRDAVEAECPGWMDVALDAVRRFAAVQSVELFTAEAMRSVIGAELPPTTRLRVWGPLVKKAIAAGYIAPTGKYAPAASSNGSVRQMYRRGPKA